MFLGLRVKLNAKYLAYFLPPGAATKGFKKNRNSHFHEILRKIVSLKIKPNHMMNI